MAGKVIEIACCFCGHVWQVSTEGLDRDRLVVYKGPQEREYSVPCPRCHTANLVTVTVEEQQEGKG